MKTKREDTCGLCVLPGFGGVFRTLYRVTMHSETDGVICGGESCAIPAGTKLAKTRHGNYTTHMYCADYLGRRWYGWLFVEFIEEVAA